MLNFQNRLIYEHPYCSVVLNYWLLKGTLRSKMTFTRWKYTSKGNFFALTIFFKAPWQGGQMVKVSFGSALMVSYLCVTKVHFFFSVVRWYFFIPVISRFLSWKHWWKKISKSPTVRSFFREKVKISCSYYALINQPKY